MIYGDWNGLPAHLAEQIAITRLLEQCRAAVGTRFLPESASLNGALAEVVGTVVGEITGNALRVYNVHLFGAQGNGATDDTAAWNAAILAAFNNGGGVVTGFPGKTYVVQNVALLSFVTLDLAGITLQLKAGAAGSDTCVKITGNTINAPRALTANANAGDTSISVSDTSGLAVGALVLLYDNTYKYTSPSNGGRNQEIVRVASIVADTSIGLEWPLLYSYTTAQTASYQWFNKGERCKVIGGTLVIPSGTNGGGIYGDLTFECSAEHVQVVGPNTMPAFRFDRSMSPKILYGGARDGQNQGTGGFGYGMLFNESTIGGFALGVVTRNLRENPCASNNARHCLFSHCDDYGAGTAGASFGTHSSGCEHISFFKCRSFFPRQHSFALNDGSNLAPDQWLLCDNCESYGAACNAFICAGANGASYNASHVHFKGCKGVNFSRASANFAGIEVDYATDVLVEDCDVGSPAYQAARGVYLLGVTDAEVLGCEAHDIAFGYGVQVQSTLGKVRISDCKFKNISSFNVRSMVANNDLEVCGCRADDTSVNKLAGDKFHDNDWGGKLDDQYIVAAGVTDGATIAHSLLGTPTFVDLQTTVAGEFASVTAVGGTTITVAIKKHDGTAGTAQTIYATARVRP